MKRTLKFLFFVIIAAFIALLIAYKASVPALSSDEKARMDNVLASETKTLKGAEGYAYNGDIRIWYESIEPRDSLAGTIILIMGISNDALAWPDYFVDPIVDHGYRVIRFDNRGVGMTDWLEDWRPEDAYSLRDMALDAVAVMDHLGIEKAHIMGASLGGMIAQTFCIEFPDRAQSLISMMSTGDMMDPDLPSIKKSTIFSLMMAHFRYGIMKSERNDIMMQIVARRLLQGENEYPVNIEDVAETTLYNLRQRKGYNARAFRHQSNAVIVSGSRHEDLKKLSLPALVIHGTDDPMIDFSHGEKCFQNIPNAEKLWLEGMGHDVPEAFLEPLLEGILNFMDKSNA